MRNLTRTRVLSGLLQQITLLKVLFCAALFLVNTSLHLVNAEEVVVLTADNNSGHDWAWSKRPYYGKSSWGIRGSRIVESGEIWFDSFPGPTGEYKILWGVIQEQDGSASYRLKAGERRLVNGRLPYLNGSKNCDGKGEARELDLGTHRLEHGEKISLWAQSVYECPWRQGAYALWYQLVFVPIIKPEKN